MQFKDPVCDIVILTWNGVEWLKPCVESVFKNTSYPFHIILVDNGSTDEKTLEYLRALEIEKKHSLEIIRNEKNEGFPKGCNIGLKRASAQYICLLNNDTLVAPNWLNILIATLKKYPKAGLVVPNSTSFDSHVMRSAQATLEESIRTHAQYLNKSVTQDKEVEEIQIFPLFCGVFKREALNKAGFFDEIFSPFSCEDSDLQMRLVKNGYLSFINKKAYVYHYVSKSTSLVPESGMFFEKNKKIFFKKWSFSCLKIVCPLWSEDQLEKNIDNIYALLRGGNRIWLILRNGVNLQSILQKNNLMMHYNLRVQYLPSILFYIACIYKVKFKKKGIHVLYAPEKYMNSLFKKINFFLNKIIIAAPDELLMYEKDLPQRGFF